MTPCTDNPSPPQVGGVVLVAPEHRNSLLLKWHEMRLRDGGEEVCSALEEVAGLRYQDLLDESDELLHHRCAFRNID